MDGVIEAFSGHRADGGVDVHESEGVRPHEFEREAVRRDLAQCKLYRLEAVAACAGQASCTCA